MQERKPVDVDSKLEQDSCMW